VLGPRECVTAATALTMFLGNRPGHPHRVEPGGAGDLCILATPPADALAELDAEAVSATVIGGELVYER